MDGDQERRLPSLNGAHIVYVTNVDWFFLSHRLPLALAALSRGARVSVLAADTGRAHDIKAQGLEFNAIPFSRSRHVLVHESATVLHLVRIYCSLRPTIAHHITLKPIVYGTLAARVSGRVGVVNALTGLGLAFRTGYATPVTRRISRALLRSALHFPLSRTIVQNPDDKRLLISERMVPEQRVRLIRGSGVNLNKFRFVVEPDTRSGIRVMLASRLLWAKGVGRFVEAARLLRAKSVPVRMILVGDRDPENPDSVPLEELENWAREGVIEWWGHQSQMERVLSQAHLVVLPTTYPEGVPKVLLEAAAVGRPIVASDVPGCREIVRHGVNGMLVPPNDVEALANAIGTLSADDAMRVRYAMAGRRIVEQEFSEERVVAETLAVYADLLEQVTK